MALAPGTRFGPFEIVAPLGAGGMGEVYRARDTKLDRNVAIKVLPASFAADPDRFARFTREAKTLAALNHPNIAHIHGLEEAAGVRALVMEFVDGEDLSALIARGPMRFDDALPVAKQIAEALEAAHEQGIIHRDLKPANIKVRADGKVKVLDFGLAKALEPAGASSPSVSQSPTLTTPAMSQAGMILGTAAYMSPEQARGKTVDTRADVWAFGAVLFEMLTSRRAYPGADITDTIVSVVSKDPDWRALPAPVPADLRRLLTRCLKKDAKARMQAIGDARVQIEELLSGTPEEAEPLATADALPRWRRALPWAVVGAIATGLPLGLALWAPWRTEQPADRPLVRLDVDLGADVSMPAPPTSGSAVAISPDGTRLAYASGNPPRLFVRRLDQSTATELPGTQDATVPLFSPDGQWVAFVAGTKLNKISVEGGAVVPIGDVSVTHVAGAYWGEDGRLLVSESFGNRGLIRLPSGGGPPEILTGLGSEELAFPQPRLLPGGRAVMFAVDTAMNVDTMTIEILTLADRKRKIVARGGHSPRYVSGSNGSGYLIYTNRAVLFAIPFDLERLETRGTAVRMLDDIAHNSLNKNGQFDVSRTGTLVYRRDNGEASAQMTVQWADPTGRREPLRATPGTYEQPSLSPDGKRIALTISDGGNRDVWVFDPQRDSMTRFTFGGYNIEPKWSPDGRSIVFSTLGKGLFRVRADVASQPHALTQAKAFLRPWSFTPDGKRLAYYQTASAKSQILMLSLVDEGGQWTGGEPEPFSRNSYTERYPSFSPDGRWLAYDSDESGRVEVYVRPFPTPSSGQGGKWPISNSGGTGARWSRTGPELVYRSGDQVMAVKYAVRGETFVAEKPRVWIAKLGGAEWDLAPDGRRVAVLTPVESAHARGQEHEVVFLLNFVDELRRRVSVGR